MRGVVVPSSTSVKLCSSVYPMAADKRVRASRESFSTYTATIPSGEAVQLAVNRGGSVRSVTVRPVDPPRDLGLRILWEIAGLHVANSRGVMIEEVANGSRSANVGLQQGDYIVGVNGNEVRSVDELNSALTNSAERSSVVLDIARGRFVYSLTFPLGA